MSRACQSLLRWPHPPFRRTTFPTDLSLKRRSHCCLYPNIVRVKPLNAFYAHHSGWRLAQKTTSQCERCFRTIKRLSVVASLKLYFGPTVFKNANNRIFYSKRDFNSKEPDFDLHPKAGNCQKTLSSVLNVFDECSISICRKTKLLRCVSVKPRPKLAIDFNGERVNHVFSEIVLKREKYQVISATCFKKYILIQVCDTFI